jgi:hypothetical protein
MREGYQKKMKRNSMMSFFLYLLVIGCSNKTTTTVSSAEHTPAISVQYLDDYTSRNKEEVLEHINIFLASVPSMQKYFDLIESVEVKLISLHRSAYVYKDYGWSKEIYLQIKLKNDTGLPKTWMADGQSYTFFLGSGNNPGVIAHFSNNEKPFTDLPIYNNEATLTSIPSLVGIDTIGGAHDPERISKINVNSFAPVFESSADFWIADGASEYINVVGNNNPFEIRAFSLGGCIIKLYYDDTDMFIKNATFSYIYNGTKYQSEMTYKLFLAFVSTLEMINNEEAGETVIDLVQKIYSIKNDEEIRSIRGNIYTFEVQGDDFIYHAKTPYQ